MPTIKSTRDQLIGAWEFVSLTSTNDADPSDVQHPWTGQAQGLLSYSPDGYISVIIQIPGKEPFTGDDLGRPCIAYGGRYYVDDEGETPVLHHNMRHCTLTRWLGDTQRRLVTFWEVGGRQHMSLSPGVSVTVNGVSRRSLLTWRRAERNDETRPPPAVQGHKTL